MSDQLVLKPDPIKDRFARMKLPAAVLAGAAIILCAIFQAFHLGSVFYVLVIIAFCVLLVGLWRSIPQNSYLELQRGGLNIVSEGVHSFHEWQDLSRITLMEEISVDAQEGTNGPSHYLTARVLGPDKADPDGVTNASDADVLIPIDSYISYRRYSDRTEVQENALKSPQDLADTLNRWRDFALNLEIGTVPTPFVQVEGSPMLDLSLKLYAKLSS
ncbi:hypothetical protein [Roseibium sp.]|uniref:hypothetical protein n=1 Tax=Roseibium sp. TaxID=1936156 RepID=UPI003D147CE8